MLRGHYELSDQIAQSDDKRLKSSAALEKQEQQKLQDLFELYRQYLTDQQQALGVLDQQRTDARQEMLLPNRRPAHLVFSFSQVPNVDKVEKNEDIYRTLGKLNKRYGGLCEIHSNHVIAKDLLGKERRFVMDRGVKKFAQQNELKINIKVSDLNIEKIRHSHILHNTNIFLKLLAIIFEIYPNSIIPAFSPILKTEKETDRKEVNQDLLGEQLSKLQKGAYVKFFAFERDGLYFSGHSMVIKKTGDGLYSFFEPNYGEYQDLDLVGLSKYINKAIKQYDASRIAFIDGNKYVKELNLTFAETRDQPVCFNK